MLAVTNITHVSGLERRPWLGAAVSTLAGGGVRIDHMLEGSSAEAAELVVGDIILRLDGKEIPDVGRLLAAIGEHRVGDRLNLEGRSEMGVLARQVQLLPVPQEQSADFDILYESVSVPGSERRTVVTRPRGSGQFPAVLFVGGIGCYPADSPTGVGDTYRQLMDRLTVAGFVTMRVEKSGVGDSTGPSCSQVDLNTEVSGYAAGLRDLAAKSYVDAAAVFIVGHSIGGVVGPMVAIEVSDEVPVGGVVGISTVGRTWIDYEILNLRRHLVLSGTPTGEISERLKQKQLCMRELLVEGRSVKQITSSVPACVEDMQYPASIQYMRDLVKLDFPDLWQRLDRDALLIYGTSDYVTDRKEHLLLADAVNSVRPGSAKYREVAQMDHALTRIESQRESYDGATGEFPGRLHGDIGPLIIDWLTSHAGS